MYQITAYETVKRVADGAFMSKRSPEYVAWLAEGNTPELMPETPFNQAAALDRLRKVRRPILDALSGLLADALTDGDAALASSIRAARQGLKDLPGYGPLLNAQSDEVFDDIALARYRDLAAALPAAARSAFRDALL